MATEIDFHQSAHTMKMQKDYNETLVDVVANLLEYQYVVNEYDDENSRRLWLTTKGTGMGRKHSGELADLVYYHKVETNLKADLEKSGAFFYARFKDDVIMMGPNESSVLRLVEILKEKTDYFKLTVTGKPRKTYADLRKSPKY